MNQFRNKMLIKMKGGVLMSKNKFDDLVNKAQLTYQQGDLKTALKFCLMAELLEENADLLIDIALLYDELSDYPQALSAYMKALEIEPEQERAYYGLGTVYEALNRVDEAIAHYKEAINLNPDYTAAHFFVANLYDDQKQIPLAMYHYERVIELDPQHFYAHLNLGSIHEISGKDELALSYFLKAELIDHENHLLYFNLGVVYRKLGRTTACIESYKKSLSLSTSYPFTFLNLGIVLKDDLGNLEESIAVYTEGIAHHARDAVLYYNRGCAYSLLKKFNLAVTDLVEAVQLHPSLKDFIETDQELDTLRDTDIFKKSFNL
jgi:tetratricopeptide (TPR) repeat protein